MIFGGQTVTFVTFQATGERGYGGLKSKQPVKTSVVGCRFRPLSVDETPDYLSNVATGIWKCTAPPVDAALNAQSGGAVEVDGVPYQIEGPVMAKPDMSGVVHHVTIMCKRSSG